MEDLPSYMLEPSNTVIQVAFAFLFSVIFLNIYIPFSQTSWFELGNSRYFYFTAGFILCALGILIITRVFLYHLKNYININYLIYIIWCLVEITLIAGAYTWVTVDFVQPEFKDVSLVWRRASYSTLLALGIPYIFSAMYLSINDKNNTIKVLKFDNVVSDDIEIPDDKITLFDNNGSLKFSVSSSNLYYIESDDNYIKVWYTNSTGQLKQYILRCKLKSVEESFKDSQLVRCHRKYIVNMKKVAILRKESDGYHIELDNEQIASSLPVSKTYVDNVLGVFSNERPLLEPIDESSLIS